MKNRVFDLALSKGETGIGKIAFSQQKRGELTSITFKEYNYFFQCGAVYLQSLGIEKGDNVCSIMTNGYEWNIIDMSVQMSGAIHVSVFPNYNSDDYQIIFKDILPKVIIVSTPVMFKLISGLISDLSIEGKVFLADDFIKLSLSDASSIEYGNKLESMKEKSVSINETDISTIYYTSGTFNRPNGVVVSHKAIVGCVLFMTKIYELKEDDSALCYLPLSHAYERSHNYLYQYNHIPVHYAENAQTVLQNLQQHKPTFFISVPMLLENIYGAMISKAGSQANTETLRKVFDELTGGRVRIISSAGAALAKHISETFLDMGIKIWEAYGMTESCPICMNCSLYGVKPGTVGTPSEGVEIKIVKDNEVFVRSIYNMKGYYKNHELTNLVMDKDGWIHTGDTGEWIEGKFLRLTGRKRDLIKTSAGLFVSPEEIEKRLLKSNLFRQVFVYPKDGLYAIFVPTEGFLEMDSSFWTENINSAIAEFYNDQVTDAEKIKHFTILTKPWTVDAGELTPNFKLKRSVIFARYTA